MNHIQPCTSTQVRRTLVLVISDSPPHRVDDTLRLFKYLFLHEVVVATWDMGGGERDGHTREVSGDEVEGEGADNGSR